MKNKFPGVYLMMILPPLFWAGNAILARFVADMIPPVSMSFWRWVIALLLLSPFTWPYVRKDWTAIKKGWKAIVMLSLIGIAAFNTLLYAAAQTTTAINIGLIQSIMPAAIVLFCYVLYRNRINYRQLCSIILCAIGAGYIIVQGELLRLLELKFVIGDLIMLVAINLYALYTALLLKRPDIHPLSLLTTTIAVGVIILFPVYLWEIQSAPPLALDKAVILSLLYVAVFPSILAYLCWNWGTQSIGANRAGLYINLIPLFTALLAIVFLGERFQAYHGIGIILIFAGLLLFNLPLKNKKEI